MAEGFILTPIGKGGKCREITKPIPASARALHSANPGVGPCSINPKITSRVSSPISLPRLDLPLHLGEGEASMQ